jgi:ABC-type sugar transport system ATPase subunit
MLLKMSDIGKSFASGPVLHGVTFTLERGQIHGLVGHNGAGKSTLMKVLGGVHPDYQGKILIDGEEAHLRDPREAHRHGIATIYQDFALVPDLSVADNIALGREPRGMLPGLLSHRQMRERSAQEAAAVGINLPMDMPIRYLGVAAQQLTEIVRALSQRPRILIMDEPTARLAPAERDHLFLVMRRMAQSGMGIVYISHFLEEVIAIADHVTVLRDGRVVTAKPASDLSVDELARLLVGTAAPSEAQSGAARPRGTGPRTAALTLAGFSVAGQRPLDLEIPSGEILGFAGLIGSGGTHLARGIIGDVASRGSVRVAGRLLKHITPRKAARAGLILVPEDRKATGLVLTGTVRANIELTALDRQLSRFGFVRSRARQRLVRAAINRFQIHPADPQRRVATLSGGNAQKVLLARAASASPRVLILDQPTAGVDVGAKTELHNQIKRLAAEGSAILLISDDLDELLELADRIAIVSGGSVSNLVSKQGLVRGGLLAAVSRNAEPVGGWRNIGSTDASATLT